MFPGPCSLHIKGNLDKHWVKNIESCPGEPVMAFSGLSNRNSLKCSTHLGKEKRKGLIFMPVIGKAQGWRRLQASRALDTLHGCKESRGGLMVIVPVCGILDKGPKSFLRALQKARTELRLPRLISYVLSQSNLPGQVMKCSAVTGLTDPQPWAM